MKFEIIKDLLVCSEKTAVRAKAINWYKLEFNFSEDWEGLSKKIVFLDENSNAYEKDINNNEAMLPSIPNGCYDIGVVGYKVENETITKRIGTNLIKIYITKSGSEINGEIPIDEEEWEEKIVGISDITELIEGRNHYITIHLTNNKTYTFDIKDGEKGDKGDKGDTGVVDYDVINQYIDSKILEDIDEALGGDY